jgi:hypothetical protein
MESCAEEKLLRVENPPHNVLERAAARLGAFGAPSTRAVDAASAGVGARERAVQKRSSMMSASPRPDPSSAANRFSGRVRSSSRYEPLRS